MLIGQLTVVLLTNGISIILRKQFHHENWRSVHLAGSALILTGTGFLVLMDLYLVFELLELRKPVQPGLTLLYASLLLLGLSLASFLGMFVGKSTSDSDEPPVGLQHFY